MRPFKIGKKVVYVYHSISLSYYSLKCGHSFSFCHTMYILVKVEHIHTVLLLSQYAIFIFLIIIKPE